MAPTKTTAPGGEEELAVTMPEVEAKANSSGAAGVDSLSWFASIASSDYCHDTTSPSRKKPLASSAASSAVRNADDDNASSSAYREGRDDNDSEGKKRQRGGDDDADHSSSEEEGRKAPRLHSSTEDDDNISISTNTQDVVICDKNKLPTATVATTVATATYLSEELRKDLSSILREPVYDEIRAIQITETKTKYFIETYRQKIHESNAHESSICNALLGLEHDAESTLEDVVVCRAQFEFAAEFVSGNKNISITRYNLFQRFLYPAIKLAWKFVVDKYNRNNSQNMIEDKTISWKVASLFFWNVGNPHKKHVMVGHSPLNYTKFQSLLKDVQALLQYHLTHSQRSGSGWISPPKADNVVPFFKVEKEIEQPQEK